MRESVDTKAKRLLCEARVDIYHRDRWQLLAIVRGDTAVEHKIRWTSGDGWRCDCTAATFRSPCAHIGAVQHVVVVNRRNP